jgi:hypothetical protein
LILKPYSFAGTSLQSSDYVASFPETNGDLQVKSQAGYVKRAGAAPLYTGKDIVPQTLALEILMQHNYMTLFESLNTLFDTKDETPLQFIATDEEDSSKQYYVYATPQQVMGGHDGPMATVILALDDPIWQSVTQNSQTWTITASTSTTDFTNNGNDDAYPIYEITPTSSPSTDFPNCVFLQVLPQSSKPWAGRPLCITGATDTTFDTAALVAAGKMQADGDDLRVYRDGVATDFWVSGINTTDTKVWVVEDMPEARNMTLKTAIGATDTVTELEITYTNTNLEHISNMPNTGYLILDASIGSTDSEEFNYGSKIITDTKLAFTIGARAKRNTTALAHAAGCNVRHHPHAYRINYGNATASAPTIDDTTKPLINLSTSSNASFVYTTFYDLAGLRAGRWTPYGYDRVRASRSDFYTSTSDEGDTDPATAIGFDVRTFQSNGTWQSDTLTMYWIGSFPDYVTSFSASGEQNQSAATIPTFSMKYNIGGLEGRLTLWTVTAQASTDYSTWTTWSKATTDSTVPPNVDALKWTVSGSVLGTSELYVKEAITAATVNLTNPPHVMIRSETSSAVLVNCKITNATTGKFFTVTIPAEVNDTIYVDTDPAFPTVTLNGQVVNGAIRLDSNRAVWLMLQPGSNTLEYENLQSVANNLTVVLKHRDRMNFF